MEIISEAPEANAFIPLIQHQSTTPASFYSGPPVLHYHSQGCTLIVLESDLAKSAALQRLTRRSDSSDMNPSSSNGGDAEVQSPTEESLRQIVTNHIDVWVTSE